MKALHLIIDCLGALCLIALLGALLGWMSAPVVLEEDEEDAQ